MESKKINQLATSVSPQTSDLTIIGDPTTGVSKKITLLQIANLFATTGTVSSVAVTESGDALTISGSPITTAGTINIGFAGDATQYIRGDGALADFPTSTGGGSSVSYYLNSSVSQGTIGGVAYRELSKDPISGAGTDITISADGYIASYITDANDPALLEVPGGNFNCEFYFSVNSNAHNPYVYAELYKYDGTTFTLLGSSQSVPEYLTNGTTLSPYYFAVPVATAALTITDRLAIRIYANVDTRTVTLHTENNHLCQVVTTFSKGLTSLNNLTRQVQFLATGTSGTDFNISSSTATHTFNIPSASATNRGLITTGTQTIAGAKTFSSVATFTNDILINSLTIGNGGGAIASNTAIGSGALAVNTTGSQNIAIGTNSLSLNSTGLSNIAIGHRSLENSIGGGGNIAVGVFSLNNVNTGQSNVGIGLNAGLGLTTGSNNIFIGYGSATGITTGSNNTIIGNYAGTTALANNIVLADGAGNVRYQWDGTNNVFGNPISGTSASFSSSLTASSLIKSGGTSSQFLMADGSVNTSVLPSGAYLPLTGGTLTGALSGTSATFTSSSFPLDIYGTTNNYGLRINNVQAATLFLYSSNANAASRNWGLFTNSEVYGDFDIRQSNAINGDLTNGANSTSRLYIKNDGNVGIGTSSPETKLHIGTTTDSENTITLKASATGANKIFFSDGTGDALYAGFIEYLHTGNSMQFGTNSAERMRITSGGNVGIGTSSPTAIGNYRSLTLDGVDGSIIDLRLNGSGNGRVFTASDAAVGIESLSTTLPLVFKTNSGGGSTERMRLTPNGTLNYNINTNTDVADLYHPGISFSLANGGTLYQATNTTASVIQTRFANPNGNVGSITTSGSSTAFNTSSDYRLKEDLKEINGLKKVSAIKVYNFKWKTSNERADGVLAHELAEVLSYAVYGEKDGEEMQAVDYSKIVPVLVKSIQELEARIKQLENK